MRCRVALCAGVCALITLALSCSSGARPNQQAAPGPDAAVGPTLPAPSVLAARLGLKTKEPTKQSSYVDSDLTQDGADFDATLPHNHAAADGINVDLTSAYTKGSPLSGLAYCTYLFSVPGYDRNNQVRLQWSIAPSPSSPYFVGLANWGTDSWDWYPFSDSGVADTGPMIDYFNFTHNLLAVLAVEGNGLSILSAIRLGALPPVAILSANPTTGVVPITVHLDASASTTSVGTITKYEWDFNGDGTYDQDTGTTPTVDHLYSSGGDITAAVRVTSSIGASATASVALQLTGPWIHTLGKGSAEAFESTASDPSGNIYATGYTNEWRPSGEVDLLLLSKWSPTGKLLWAKTWDGGFKTHHGQAVQVDSDSNIIVAGEMVLTGGEHRAVLQKWTPGGTLAWCRQYKDSQTGHAGFQSMKTDGTDIYAAGYGPNYEGVSTPLVMKIDTSGSPQWEHVFQTSQISWVADLALRWTYLTGTNAVFALVQDERVPVNPAILQFDLDGTMTAHMRYTDSTNDFYPRGFVVAEGPLDHKTSIYIDGAVTLAGRAGLFITSCDDSFNVLGQSDWHAASDVSVLKIMFGTSSDVYVCGFMPGLDVGSYYGMLWRFSTTDTSLLSSEYLDDGSQQVAFYNIGWYQGGMLLVGQAYDASASWNTLTGSTDTPAGQWYSFSGLLADPGLAVDNVAGAVDDFTGYTEDTGGGGNDALLLWRPTS